MTTSVYERNVLKSVYGSTNWAEKVDQMNDAQINDIILSLMAQGKLTF